ncbi:30S ribosomal protein S20 [Mesoaciditoga lauensis]|uniref:30S ribosomal protein S20 n=1 Tax=Mesoaciditoga lauensis TaxID=1495039 RepID=UPI000563AD6D|nr:30S ribosomal protein S20 [Mesoaciditoga lauensis]
MANSRSAKKRVRASERKRIMNQIAKSKFKTAVKKALSAAENGEEDLQAKLSEAFSKIDKAAKSGAIHKNQAARRKSRLIKKIRLLQQTK